MCEGEPDADFFAGLPESAKEILVILGICIVSQHPVFIEFNPEQVPGMKHHKLGCIQFFVAFHEWVPHLAIDLVLFCLGQEQAG